MNTKTKNTLFLLMASVVFLHNGYALELGVQTHFGQGRGDLASAYNWMKSAKMQSFRDEIYWDHVELQRGVFKADEQVLMSLQAFKTSQRIGINPLLTLSFGNPLYDGGSQPYTAEGRAAFGAYAGWLANLLKGKVEYFEIWNEWNVGAGKKTERSHGDPVDYVKIASIAYDAIKAANPDAKVIVGGFTDLGIYGSGWPWLNAAIKAGLLNKADGVSPHIYNQGLPDNELGASDLISRLQKLQAILRANNSGKPIPIYVTETGWSTHLGQAGVSEQIAAEQSARLLLEAMTVEDLAGIWWYELLDGGDDPTEKEHHFGLLRASLEEKPAGCRLRSLASFVRESSLTQKISNGGAQALLFKGKDGRALLAAWSGDGITDTVHDIEVTGNFGSVKAFDKACGDRVIQGFKGATANNIQIKAGTYPTLIWVEGNANITGIVPQ